jgi:hypothetical protein
MAMASSCVAIDEFYFQFIQQFYTHFREIIDEVERVLYLVRYAGGKLAQRRHFFGLDQLVLGLLQVGKRLVQLGGAFCYLLLQLYFLRGNYFNPFGLVLAGQYLALQGFLQDLLLQGLKALDHLPQKQYHQPVKAKQGDIATISMHKYHKAVVCTRARTVNNIGNKVNNADKQEMAAR